MIFKLYPDCLVEAEIDFKNAAVNTASSLYYGDTLTAVAEHKDLLPTYINMFKHIVSLTAESQQLRLILKDLNEVGAKLARASGFDTLLSAVRKHAKGEDHREQLEQKLIGFQCKDIPEEHRGDFEQLIQAMAEQLTEQHARAAEPTHAFSFFCMLCNTFKEIAPASYIMICDAGKILACAAGMMKTCRSLRRRN